MYKILNILNLYHLIGSAITGFRYSDYMYVQTNEVKNHAFPIGTEVLTRRLSLVSDHQNQNHLYYLFFNPNWRYNDVYKAKPLCVYRF